MSPTAKVLKHAIVICIHDQKHVQKVMTFPKSDLNTKHRRTPLGQCNEFIYPEWPVCICCKEWH